MKRFLKFLILGSILLFYRAAVAQNCSVNCTTVSATVIDSDGTTWANGSWSITFLPNQTQPYATYYQNGVALNPNNYIQKGSLDGSGNFSVSVWQNTTVTPVGSTYVLQVCPNASAKCGTYSFSTSTTSLNVSSNLTTTIPAPRFNAVAGSYGYADIEAILSLPVGANYWNVTNNCQRYYSSGSFACVSGGSGCTVGGLVNQLVTNNGSSGCNSTTATIDNNGNMLVPQSINGVQTILPSVSDPCAAITSALARLPSTGGKIDVSGVSGGTCASTLTVNKPVQITWGTGVFIFNGSPGINITSRNVSLIGYYASSPAVVDNGTTFESGTAAPLVENNTNGADNLLTQGIYFDGNGVGTFGILAPYGAAYQYINLGFNGFTYQAISSTQGVGLLQNVWVLDSGEGALITSDTSVLGQAEFEQNTPGSGLHIIGGGGFASCQSCDHNGFWGIYLDGRTWSDWAASTSYTQYQIIVPTSNNAGGYAFESDAAASSSSSRPTFPQTVGATVTDGSQKWVNIGVLSSSNTVSYAHLTDIYANENGQTGSGGDVLVDGGLGFMADHDYLTSIHTAQQNSPTKAVYGTKINNAGNIAISGIGYYGSNFTGSGTDLGALYISGSSQIEVTGLTSWYSATTPLYITGSSFNVHINNASLNLVGSSGTPTASTYCVHIDSSFQTIINGLACLGSTAWAHGISDAGTDTTIANYKNYTTNAATDDSINAISIDSDLGGIQSRTLNGNFTTTLGQFYFPYSTGFLGSQSGVAGNWVNRRYIWSLFNTQDYVCFGVPSSATTGSDASVCRLKLGADNSLVSQAGNFYAPVASGFVSGHCGEPTLSGGLWTIVDSGGACGTSSGVTSWSGDGALYTNSLSTGAVTATLGTTGAHKWWGNPTGSTGTPGYNSLTTADLPTGIPLANLATQSANTMIANVTASTATPTAVSIPAGIQFYTAGTGYSAATSANLLGVCTTCVVASSPGAGIAHFAGSTQTVTSSSVVGSDMANNTVTATQLATQYSKRVCVFALGDGVNAIAAATYPASGAILQCVNNSGVTWTVTGIHVWSDDGTSTIDVKNNGGTSFLTAVVTGSSTKTNGGAAGTQSGTTTLANTDGFNFVLVASGTTKAITATVDFTY